MNGHRLTSFALLTVLAAGSALAGPLDPPAGPVTSTFKTLTEVEPRTAISSVNTPGDNDSSPSVFKITQPGSYYLAANITGVTGKTAIEVAANNVTIDLNGFAIQGGKLGIVSGSNQGLTVRNGFISDTTDTAIRGWSTVNPRIERVTIRNSGGVGIDLGTSSLVESCLVTNASLGIRVGSNSVVKHSTSSNCVNVGFDAQNTNNVTFEACTSTSNGGHGFMMAITNSGRIERCTASNNGDRGFWVSTNITITACTANSNASHGIAAYSNCVLTDNVCTSNGGSGIEVSGFGNVVKSNRLISNTTGVTVSGADNAIVGNWCRGNTTANFTVANGNEFAPVITNPGSTNYAGATAFSNFAY